MSIDPSARARSQPRVLPRDVLITVVAALAAALIAGGVWLALHRTAVPPDLTKGIASMSYNFTEPGPISAEKEKRLLKQIDKDMGVLSRVTTGIRLYSASGIYSKIPEIARRHGLSVTAGAWVGANKEFTKKELEAAIQTANRNTNVRSVVVGNETILRKELKPDELKEYLRYVRRRVRVPVTTGETWDVWLKYPELAREVDFIAAHILPYWEGIDPDRAVKYAFERYDQLKQAFPGKKIEIAEFGWPSQGYNNRNAATGRLIQAEVLRKFIAEANRRGIPYNIIEAFDQPWKGREGTVGAYWGVYDANRMPKFPLYGAVQEKAYTVHALLAIGLGLLISLLALIRRRPTPVHALAFSIAAQALSAGMALAFVYPLENYLNFGAAVAWVVGVLLMVPLTATTLIKVNEVAEVAFGRRPRRLIDGPIPTPEGYRPPKVSIHIPAYREAPDMLCRTLDSVAALDYPDFEALVIVNNTPEESFWKPVAEHCAVLGERFKFVFLPKVDGFKAGALNAALPRMAPDAEVIAMIDADYVVHKDWLKDLVPAFADPVVGMVQAPQDHRDGAETPFKAVINSEYAGFFDIGMVQRNEDNAIIAHGTMLLLSRKAFEEVGGWATDTITEDTELGLRLFAAGYEARYTDRRYGWGLLPDSYRAFKSQRDRWAYGAMQIIRKHLPLMRPGDRRLTGAQKYQYLSGWSYWLSDSFGVIAAHLNLLWAPMIIFVGVLIPTLPFTLPILAAFGVNLLHCCLLYAMRVRLPRSHIPGAALAAMSLQFTVARAVVRGLTGKKLAFLRTEKGGLARLVKAKRERSPIRAETALGIGLLVAGLAVHLTNIFQSVVVDVFAATLVIQSTPFLAAPVMVLLEWFGRRWEERRTTPQTPNSDDAAQSPGMAA